MHEIVNHPADLKPLFAAHQVCVCKLQMSWLNAGGSLQPWGLEKLYDVAYSNQGGEWNDWARNWTLAKPSFIQLIAETNATVLILGRDLTKEEDLQPLIASGNIVSHEKALWRDFLKLIEQSRSLVTFNVHDASPRVLAEAMCMDVPVLINWHILGGWKYATEQTGEDFVDTASFIQAYKRLREPERQARLRPRQWYRYQIIAPTCVFEQVTPSAQLHLSQPSVNHGQNCARKCLT